MKICLSASDVRKSYGAAPALRGASLELYQGEILALLGPNGAGKTTLIKILATLLRRDGGKVEILGYDLDTHENQARHLFGYVGQDTDRSAYARLTVRENLRFFGALRGLSKRQADAQIDRLADYFDIRHSLDKLFQVLSGGQKQTVVIMRALLYDPPLVFLDEPTKGLDPLVAAKIRSFLKRYVREEGKSLLLTSHILGEVDDMADRVALIHNGTIPITGTPEQLKQAVGVQAFIELKKDGLTPRVREELTRLEQVVVTLDRDTEWVAFGITDPLDGAEAIIKVLRNNGARTPFRNRAVSLEDAFVHHLGVLADRFEA